MTISPDEPIDEEYDKVPTDDDVEPDDEEDDLEYEDLDLHENLKLS